jgi:hypothetical protein
MHYISFRTVSSSVFLVLSTDDALRSAWWQLKAGGEGFVANSAANYEIRGRTHLLVESPQLAGCRFTEALLLLTSQSFDDVYDIPCLPMYIEV